jgi:hypothetical protein
MVRGAFGASGNRKANSRDEINLELIKYEEIL